MATARTLFYAGMIAAALSMSVGCAGNRPRPAAPVALPELPETAAELSAEDRYRLAVEHFIIARDYERRGMRGAAVRYYEIARDFDPGSKFLRKTLTDLYIQTEEYDKALALFGGEAEIADMNIEDKRTVSLIYLKLGELEKAAALIEAFGEERSDEEVYSLGLLYESLGRKDKALDSFKAFFKGNRGSVGLGIRLVQLNIGERRIADAESLAVILREAYPDNADVVSLLGTVRYLGRDTTGAVALFDHALELDSLNEEALRTLAHIHVVRNEYDKAVVRYKRLIALKDAGSIYRRGLAMLSFHTKNFEEAEKLFDAMLEERFTSDVQNVQELHLYRGLIYSQTERRQEAAREFEAAIAADPLYDDAWRELCYLYILSKEHEKALEAVDRFQKAFPLSGAGWKLRGYALNAAERREEAVESLRKAAAIDSLDYYTWFELGSVLERLKRIDEAAAAFKEALRIRPGDASALNYLGYMWADANMMLDSAKILIEAALEKEPKNGAYLDSYAWVFYRLGDYDSARRYMLEAIEQMSGEPDPVLYEHLGDVQFKLEDYKSAEAAYKRSLELKSEAAARIKERLAEIKKIMKGKGR